MIGGYCYLLVVRDRPKRGCWDSTRSWSRYPRIHSLPQRRIQNAVIVIEFDDNTVSY